MKKLLFTFFFLSIVWNLSTANTLKDCETKEDKISGCIDKKYYDNGNLKLEEPYKNGKKEGVVKVYSENGNLEAEIPFKNDMIEGIAKGYYDNGSLLLESPYKNGKKEGVEKHYYNNGDLALSITYQNDNIISSKCANGKALTNAHISNLRNKEWITKFDYEAICKK